MIRSNIITYKGIVRRLQLPPDFDVKSLVRSRSELFRPGVQQRILNNWKSEMLAGKSLPSWIRDIEDVNERIKIINELGPDDVFRSQFRVERDAPKAELNVLDWGLQHIERLRKSRLESKDARDKSIQMWILIVISALNIILAITNIVIASGNTNFGCILCV